MEKSKGINLIEVLIVLAVIGIMTAALSPSFSRFLPSVRLSGAAKELTIQLRKAQQYAVTEQIIYQVTIFPTENKYQLIKKTDPEQIVTEVALPQTISFGTTTLSPPEISFNPAGRPSQSGKIELLNQRNKKIIIEIGPAGFIRSYNE
jgi:prepilin-type N-terminal cleavage/methylation domain-containing protein|uniref:Prepilin-type N-terminal cleavage/methylation domain-containing protein n=1 Tax=candidate division CPR3 bacterium TaxID=2268181 RepID=A0A7V3J9K5_UNCC3